MLPLEDGIIINAVEQYRTLVTRLKMIHGDLRLSNLVLEQTSKKIYFIDWEQASVLKDAVSGSPERLNEVFTRETQKLRRLLTEGESEYQ